MKTTDRARQQTQANLKLCLAYALVGSLWILLSDHIVPWLTDSLAYLTLLNNFKGWLYVIVTALLLFTTLQRRSNGRWLPARQDRGQVGLLLGYLLAVGVILALVAVSITTQFRQIEAEAAERLQTLSRQHARQLGTWVDNTQRALEQIESATAYSEQFRRWKTGDAQAVQRLLQHLDDFRRSHNYLQMQLFTPEGLLLWDSLAPLVETPPHWLRFNPAQPATLPAGFAETARLGHIALHLLPGETMSGQYLAGQEIEVLAALPAAAGTPRPVVVFRTRLAQTVLANLRDWPTPSRSGEMVLFRQQGQELVYLTPLRNRATPGTTRMPISSPDLPSARLLRGEAKAGEIIQGRDYQGVAVLTVIRPVPGTDWFLITKQDVEEIMSQAHRHELWLELAGLLALFAVTLIALSTLRQMETREMNQAMAERLALTKEFELLHAIAEGASDAIFAKDLAGRYVVLNTAACRWLQGRAETLLGLRDRDLFPHGEAAVLEAKDQEIMLRGETTSMLDVLTTPSGVVTFETTKGPIRDAQGQIIGIFGIARDVSARLLAEAALRERLTLQAERDASVQRLKLALAATRQGVWEWNLQTRTLYWSPELQAMMPLDNAEPQVEDFFQHIHPDDQDLVKRTVLDALENHAPLACDFRFQATEGSTRWVASTAEADYDPQGNPLRMIGTLRDISARKATDEALKVSNTRLKLALSAGELGVWEVDIPGANVFCSEEAQRITGLRQATIPLNAFADHLHPADRSRVMEGLQQAVNESQPLHEEFRFQHGKGSTVWLSCMGQVAQDAFPAQRLIGLLQNITPRKQAERLVRQLSLAVEQSPSGIMITNTEGSIEYVNPAFTRITGYSEAEVMGQNPRFLQSGQTSDETYSSLWAALTAGEPWAGELVNRRRTGEVVVEYETFWPIRNPEGVVVQYMCIMQDVTEQRRLSAELAQHRDHLEKLVSERTAELAAAKDLAEKANLAKSIFLANMSHEIRTPLNVVLGVAWLLRHSGLDDPQTRQLAKIDVAAKHLLALINEILDFSKIEAGGMPLENTRFALIEVLDGVASLIRDAAADKNLKVTVDYGNVPETLFGDPTRLRQALLNYASNAVKFTTQGSIHLRAQVLEVESDDGQAFEHAHGQVAEPEHGHANPLEGETLQVRFEVQDSGCGIDANTLSRLFQPFEQADASTTRKHGGTGLGLAITRRLAEMMGGKAGAHSQPGHGSTFWFTARLQRAAPDWVPTPPVVDDAAQRLKTRHGGTPVLVVDDYEVNREVIATLLADVGLHPTLAASGPEALALASTQDFALIVMDVQLPGMDGLETTRQIHALPQHHATPVLAFTASAFSHNRAACLQAGMCDFLAKPVDPDNLFRTLARWLDNTPESAPHATADGPPPDASPTPPASVPGMAAKPLLASLLPGINLNHLRAHTGPQEDLMQRQLRRFADQYREHGARMADWLSRQDLDALTQSGHTLVGEASHLGARGISDMARALVTTLHAGESDPALATLTAHLGEALDALVNEIDRALAPATEPVLSSATPETAPVQPPPDPARINGLLRQLARLLAAGDMEANELARSESALIATLRDGPHLLSLLARFDYETAHSLVESLLQADG